MRGKIVLITGSTDGIGKQTALELAQMGATVIVHGRSEQKVQSAQQAIRQQAPQADLQAATADLASLGQVRAMAADIRRRFERLDVLIHNAGVFLQERRLSSNGYEMTLAVNHLAPFLLTRELLDLLVGSRARVITVASATHARARIDFYNLNAEHHFDGFAAYAQSKLANVFFARELAERLKIKGVTSNCLHPGAIGTKLLKAGFNSQGASVEQGAATPVYLASSPDVAQTTGKYFVDCEERPVAPLALDRAVQQRLWQLSEQMVGAPSPVRMSYSLNQQPV
jgi:NAD(P)-dependent dehydrogenase (short-subunit alcohol dehydrogenase family)